MGSSFSDHQKFATMLQECLNKKSLLSRSSSLRNKNNFQTFNNLLVKKSLESITSSKNGIKNQRVLSAAKDRQGHPKMQRYKDKKSAVHLSERDSTPCGFKWDHSFVDSSKGDKDNFFNNDLCIKGNYNVYLKHLKQRKNKPARNLLESTAYKNRKEKIEDKLNLKIMEMFSKSNDKADKEVPP